MTLSEALSRIEEARDKPRTRRLFLVCGFEPLHLRTFLSAHLAQRFDGESAEIKTGLYGDLEGTLASAAASDAGAAALVLEWSNLDPRLGLRSAGGWHVSVQGDILATCRDRFARILDKLRAVAAHMPVAVVPPTLSIPFLGHSAGWQIGVNELEMEKLLITFLADAARIERVSILNPARLAALSPAAKRLNAAGELSTGFPYTLEHASIVAGEIVQTLFPPGPMKGLITDLDGTFWSGIVGELGAAGVSWNMADHTQVHGLYQQLLRHFSEMGVLLAVASKNELSLAEETMRRADLYIPAGCFFPMCADWGAKSRHVAEILRVWNIGADSVVFVDDSPMELEEVKTVFPSMTCLQFSKQPAAALSLFVQLRDLFGKPVLQQEDALRQASLKAFHESAPAGDSVDFVRGLNGTVTFDVIEGSASPRLLELVNKTNQFNLNGARISEAQWLRHLEDESGFVVSVSYQDKFGPLGVIAVVAGKRLADCIDVSTWVMSCRAFSRHIEFHTLEYLFESMGAAKITFAFCATERNQPLQQLFENAGIAGQPGTLTLTREQFAAAGHIFPHQVAG
ncbi:MAG TPA: HAD-IIIC family phosphatase [Bryobacteraceae bacterium]|jgi:FkbH-like protein|nr:HAD-IIIC family phosphatase [Bryobacteraceae bacterium]